MGTYSPSCSVLGTPDDRIWPGVSELPDYKPTFPQWSPQPLPAVIPSLDEDGYDMLQVRLSDRSFGFPSDYPTQQSLTYNQAQRISAKRMKRHAWFDSHRETLPKKGLLKERAALPKIGMSNGVIPNW
jgi:cyclin-dependent kinase